MVLINCTLIFRFKGHIMQEHNKNVYKIKYLTNVYIISKINKLL